MGIAKKLAAVMGEVDYIQKEKRAGMRYSIVSHDAVTAKVRPILVKHGVIYYPLGIQVSQDGNRTQVTMTVRFRDVDDDSHIDVATAGYGIDDQDKGPGKAISYAVKYALLKCLGLETGDDPDVEQDKPHVPDIRVGQFLRRIENAATKEELLDIHVAAKDLPESIKAQLRSAFTAKMGSIK